MGKMVPKINKETCIGCGACVDACTKQALEMDGDKAKLAHPEKCESLQDCKSSCPVDAIEMVDEDKL